MLLAAMAGLCAAAGVLMVVSGLAPAPVPPARRPRRRVTLDPRRVVRATALCILTAVVTRWPVAALAMGGVGWLWPELFGGRVAREHDVARTEAIAAWTEMLRDTISGAHGLEEAIVTSASVAPEPIRPEATALAVRLQREPLPAALARFADELTHPTGDLVVTALTLAAQGSAGELTELLGTLAVAARDEAAMQLRIEASRARLRAAVRVITAVTAATAVGLLVLNRRYLDSYGSPLGQVVLFGVAACWAAALNWLSRTSRFLAPERFLSADSAWPAT